MRFLETDPSLIHGLFSVPLEPERPRQHCTREDALVKLAPGRQTPIRRRDPVSNDVFGALARLLMSALHLQNETAQASGHQTRGRIADVAAGVEGNRLFVHGKLQR